MRKNLFCIVLVIIILATYSISYAQSTSAPEENGITLVKITDESKEHVTAPEIEQTKNTIKWYGNQQLALSPDGAQIAYITSKQGQRNVFVRSTSKTGAIVQRSFRTNVQDVSWSPDGKNICFAEVNSYNSLIFMVNAFQGGALQQISGMNNSDYGPTFSPDGKSIFFSRYDARYGYTIWSYNREGSYFTNYSVGKQVCCIDNKSYLCTRQGSNGLDEIWLVNYEIGSETLILSSNDGKSFSTPSLSPDGKWVLCVGTSPIPNDRKNTQQLDLYVVRIDGTGFTQLTFHRAHDCSPIWSPDGKSIYFLSNRGSEKDNIWNIWKMSFNYAE